MCKALYKSSIFAVLGFFLLSGIASAEPVSSDIELRIISKYTKSISPNRIVVALVPKTNLEHVPARTVVAQSNAQFTPFVAIAQRGAEVEFPNRDKFAHHVYSFSEAMSFELALFSGSETRQLVFEKPGIISIGCNIHDWMFGYIAVVDTPYYAFLDNDKAKFQNVVSGEYDVVVWHPSMDDFWTYPVTIVSESPYMDVPFPVELKPVEPLPTPNFDDEEEDY